MCDPNVYNYVTAVNEIWYVLVNLISLLHSIWVAVLIIAYESDDTYVGYWIGGGGVVENCVAEYILSKQWESVCFSLQLHDTIIDIVLWLCVAIYGYQCDMLGFFLHIYWFSLYLPSTLNTQWLPKGSGSQLLMEGVFICIP